MCTHLMISVPSNPGQNPPDTAKTYVSGRAMELPGVLEQSVYVMPRNQAWPLQAGQGGTTLQWKNPYGFVGIAPSGRAWASQPAFCDGINTEGLSVGALWLAPGTEYPPIGTQGNQVSYLDFPAWILGNFASVEDFLAALPTISVVGPAPGTPSYVPLHFIVTDSTGQSAVIEFIGGKLTQYKCTNGVMTNWPTYDWQLTNVQNYFNLTLVGSGTSTTGAGNPVGGGLVGLPGDSLSSSRFVRATILSQGFSQLPADGTGWLPAPGVFATTPPSKNPPGFAGPEQTAVMVALQLTQICMGTPYGMLLETVQNSLATTGIPATTPPSSTTTYGDYTLWTSVRDHTNCKYYFMSAFSGILTMIDLSLLNFDTTPAYPNNASIAVLPQGDAPWCADATKLLTPATSVAGSGRVR
ncbi:linear amide C-N hydrolase [Polyangium mundeleinium]|uniref:Linear amide C-N hydrolase n=1 Tax=Polyangium mundeleinium TaxID=2995306 RepID=A0ABT5EP20_9BACT|nr:linear amide C-N hydrolase [Polyangium mundeleinium]MDC0743585.1 linear amide C-N hydrolase [Polyangium mundeleinium]